MSAVGNLVVNFLGNTEELKKSINSVKEMVSGLAGTLVATLGAGVSIEAAREDIGAQKKLQAVLAATGQAAGLTALDIRNLASSLQETTNFADETTVSAAAVLATFRGIKGDVFKDALKSAQDLATVFGKDLDTAAIQVGKALQDPIGGLASLHKIGIAFNEDQKAQIKSMVEANNLLGAQKVILDQLKGSFGGAAQAMASPFTQLKNQLNEIAEEIGKSLLAPMKVFANFVLPFLKRWGGEIARVGVAIIATAAALKIIPAALRAVAIGQAMVQSLAGPAGWANLAIGAAVFAGSLALVNQEFGKIQAELDANQERMAAFSKTAQKDAGGNIDEFLKQLDADADARREAVLKMKSDFRPADVTLELAKAANAFGRAHEELPWFVKEGIIERASGVISKISDLRQEIDRLSGTSTQAEQAVSKMIELNVPKELIERFRELNKQRDALLEQKKIMEDMTAEGKRLFEATRTPLEKMESEIKRINELFAAGKIDAETRDRAIAKAQGGLHTPEKQLAGAAEFGGQEALSNIFAAMNTKAQTAQDKANDLLEQQLQKADKTNELLQNIEANGLDIDLIAGTV